MQTISDLRRALGLNTLNQARNRIEAIKDLLGQHLRRGPNNQILVSEGGVDLLRQLQDLYDSGLTLTEASEVLRSNIVNKGLLKKTVSSGFVQKQVIADDNSKLVAALKEEIAFLRQRVAFLEEQLKKEPAAPSRPWWESLREQVDGA